jgi:glycine dehydrogenase
MITRKEKLMEAFKDSFISRHIGPREKDIETMLREIGLSSLDDLVNSTVPKSIRSSQPLKLGKNRSETDVLNELKEISKKNKIYRSFLGMGYSDCITPSVIQRNILENPAWYTQYTPYQAEIAQGRLEALLNYQTMIMDLTALPLANASMLDEATAAAEAMSMFYAAKGKTDAKIFFVSEACHPQVIAVVRTRAEPLGIQVIVGDHQKFEITESVFGVLVQYPSTDGIVFDYKSLIDRAHTVGAKVVMSADLMSLVLLTPPGELGADVAVGNSQRFGVPLGYGGPHAAYFAAKDEYKRLIPGRIVGVSKDARGKSAYRLALQTREQHIRRDKATSNICTAQVLLAVIASMYAVYHGPEGLKRIAGRIHGMAWLLKSELDKLGYETGNHLFFDTLKIRVGKSKLDRILAEAKSRQINLRVIDSETLTVALDEATTDSELKELISIFAMANDKRVDFVMSDSTVNPADQKTGPQYRTSPLLTHPVFNQYRSETEMLRYMYRLQQKDLSLTTSMIPLGSCTMKLNATSEMLPITWPEFSKIHPFVPLDQVTGYRTMLRQLEAMLEEVTGFAAISLQPNAGSQGEYAGLLVIRKYHQSRGEGHRDVCLIPRSAHGTNPASAAMVGMKVVVVECDSNGNVDLNDLKNKAAEHRKNLSALMVTYPSTHGVFEESISEICSVIHENGGQVYMDGANMNAQIGLCRPGDFGPDVCHLNLHKTFCIPHGGGGPGMGPIGVSSHLAPFLPTHPVIPMGIEVGIGPVSAAPWGSASILPISWMYMMMMGAEGLKKATQVAILNANYIAKKLAPHYPVLYQGKEGFVAHECIFDLRAIKEATGVEVEDVAKRLMDYGFHAPTISFPVPGTMMVEPTESESKEEIDRFCEAMISIRKEVAQIESGKADPKNNLLKNAPHTAEHVIQSEWNLPYSREAAAFPVAWVRENKFWPSVSRINNVLGDRNLICACPPIDAYE